MTKKKTKATEAETDLKEDDGIAGLLTVSYDHDDKDWLVRDTKSVVHYRGETETEARKERDRLDNEREAEASKL